jgi:aminoglycoside phosphotransferase (APT) family kinase protein
MAGEPLAIPVRQTTLDRGQLTIGLTGWLQRLFGDPDLAITSLNAPGGAGVNNETLLLTVSSAAPQLQDIPGLVVRLEAGTTLFPDVDIEMQYQLYSAFEKHPEAPTPRAFGFEPDASVLGRRFYVMELIEGTIPSDNPPYQKAGWFTELSVEERRALWTDAVRAMGKLHRVPLADVAFLRDRGLGGVTEHMALIRRCYERSRNGKDVPLLEQTWDWLVTNVPADAPEGFAWGDARCQNMIFRGTRCVGILDWDMASLAGAECDLAWWLIFDLTGNGGGESLPGILTPAETVQVWEESIGRKARNLEFWLMFNLFWLGGIMNQLTAFLAGSGAPEGTMKGRDTANTATSILHTRFGTGVDQGLGTWDHFREVLK